MIPRMERLPGRAQAPLSRLARVDALEFDGVPEAVAWVLRDAIGWRPGDIWGVARPRRVCRSLLERFPCLGDLDYSRSWADHRVSLHASMRRPLARTASKGKPAGLLWENGVVFDPPWAEASVDGLPLVDIGGKPPDAELGGLADLLKAVSGPDAVPAALLEAAYEPGDGWALQLADGTRLLWGKSGWTEEKLARLRQVLADAKPRFGRTLTADLKHFEDGKIFVRVR